MKLKYFLPLIVLLAMVTALYAKGGLFKKKVQELPLSRVYFSMAYPSHLDGVRALDALTGSYVRAKLNQDHLWELSVDTTHRYHIEVLYNSSQGSFKSLSFSGVNKKVASVDGSHWYRVTKASFQFSNGSSYTVYGCQGTNCFE